MKSYKLVIRLEGVREEHLPRLIHTMQKAGRLLHGDAMLLVGGDPPPEIILYGEDLDYSGDNHATS